MNIQEKLNEYSREIYGDSFDNPDDSASHLTIEMLIESHRRLRQENKKSVAERNAEIQRIRGIVEQQTREMVKHGEYISVARLREMTIAEIAEFLS